MVNLVLRNATSCAPCARAKAACKPFDADGAQRKAKDETAKRAQVMEAQEDSCKAMENRVRKSPEVVMTRKHRPEWRIGQ